MGSAVQQLALNHPLLPIAAPASGAAPVERKTILLVDDNESLRTLALGVLESAGYTVREAGSAEDAIAISAQLERIDLLISDVVMPGANGLDLGSDIAGRHAQMSTLFVSGYSGEDVLNDLFTGEFLQKPFTMRDLLAKVAELLTP